MPSKIIISSCLTGVKCAYDGKARVCKCVAGITDYIPLCPEMLGGLSVPRERHEIVGGIGSDVLDGKARVMSCSGKDNTESFLIGARRTLDEALRHNVKVAILKKHSPSCGVDRIHAGRFNGTLCEGQGVTTALLRRHGVKVYSENEYSLMIDDCSRGGF